MMKNSALAAPTNTKLLTDYTLKETNLSVPAEAGTH
jgi:hypothetical protein